MTTKKHSLIKKNVSCKNTSVLNKAICVLAENNNNVSGTIEFIQYKNNLKIIYEVYGLSNGKHGFHIHAYGDLTESCSSTCGHFNPHNSQHGGLHSKHRHAGDLGNIISKNEVSKGVMYTKSVSLFHNNLNILGRSIVIHDKEDDLGKGGNDESLVTGNAGKRLACGVIGLRK
uniref:Superoxide dismutase copper/zinc binding domain-containing protein n=1 Tax=viral metagenome TaxID=1070528 RepID=A0A6C0C292_9ZZZZ